MTDDPIRDELHRLSEEFGKLLGSHSSAALVEKTTPENLMVFGLTLDEAKAWLQNEPCFRPSDEFLQRDKHRRNRRGLYRTANCLLNKAK
jgi:hypothetical protein